MTEDSIRIEIQDLLSGGMSPEALNAEILRRAQVARDACTENSEQTFRDIKESRRKDFKDAWAKEWRVVLDPSGMLERVRANPMLMVQVSGVPEAMWDMLGTKLWMVGKDSALEDMVCETVVIHEDVLARRSKAGENLVGAAVRQMLRNGCSIIYAGRRGSYRPSIMQANAPDVTQDFNPFAVACRTLLGMACRDVQTGNKGLTFMIDGKPVSALSEHIRSDGGIRTDSKGEWTVVSLDSDMALAVHVWVLRAVMTGAVHIDATLTIMADWVDQGRIASVPDDTGPQSLGDTPGISRIRARLTRLLTRLKTGHGGRTGILLHGMPGTGKTMIAKSMARESGRNFVQGSVGDWQGSGTGHLGDMLGAMKATFDEARSLQPSLLFIDELDSIGRRDTGGSNETYWRVVINAFLEHVAGTRDRGDVVLVGATNDKDALDDAVVRAGRFGEHVHVPEPRRVDTEEIIGWYLAHTTPRHGREPNVTPANLALRCMGASPALVRALVEEAVQLADEEECSLCLQHFLKATRTVVGEGSQEDDPTYDKGARLRSTAVHEAGHALAIRALLGDEVVMNLVTAIPSLSGVGAVIWTAQQGRVHMDAGHMICRGIISMAGRAAQMLIDGTGAITFGANRDMEHARWAANYLVGHGITVKSSGVFTDARDDDSDAFVLAVDEWLGRFHKLAHKLLSSHQDVVRRMAGLLVERGDLEEAEIMDILGGVGLHNLEDLMA